MKELAARPTFDAAPQVPWARIETFAGQLTHDVRNGLNALDLQLTLLSQLSTDADTLSEIRAMRGTVVDISRLLQTVKTHCGPVNPHFLHYPAPDFFEDLHDRFQRLHPEDAGQCAWSVAAEGVSLWIDPELMLIAFLEILANAMHFGRVPLAMSFDATAAAGGAALTVTLREHPEAAPALPCAEWGRTPLFTTRRGAYGLGLFRVRRIVEMHGGEYSAAYAENTGVLTTSVTLPAAANGA